METAQPTPRKYSKKIVYSVFIIGLLAMGVLGYQVNSVPKSGSTSTQLICSGAKCNLQVPISVNLALQINVSDHGKLLSSNTFPHDLILNNFYQWLIALLNNAQSSALVQTSGMKNTAGSTQQGFVWGVSAAGGGTCQTSTFNCAFAGQGGLIEVGSGSTAAARADTNIQNAFQSYFDTSSVCSTSTTDSVVISGSENANSGVTMSESGLFYQFEFAGSTPETIMLAHDVFSGIVVSGGNTITIQYTWSLNNGGFNYNLCELLAGYWTQPNGSGNQVKTPNSLMVFFDTAGRNVSWVPICSNTGTAAVGGLTPLTSASPTASGCASWASGDTNNAMQINIGTGSSAFTPTTRALTSQYASNYITSTTYDSAGNAYETANIVLTTGTTISEAAIYLTLPKGCIGYSPLHSAGAGSCITSYGSDTIMLLAATFTGQVVPNGQSIGITFQESG